jgi:hypothetical protein
MKTVTAMRFNFILIALFLAFGCGETSSPVAPPSKSPDAGPGKPDAAATDMSNVDGMGKQDGDGGNAPSLTLSIAKTVKVTDGSVYGAASFARIFERAGGFYVFVHGVRAEFDGQGPPTDYAEFSAIKLDDDLAVQGSPIVLSLTSKPGDFAIAKAGNNFYHLTGYAPGWLLAKFDGELNNIGETTIKHTQYDRANDMVLNYTNGKLHMMSLYGESMGMSPEIVGPIYGHHFTYDTDLKPAQTDNILKDVEFMAWGGSIIHQGGEFHVITADGTTNNQTSTLSAHHFDSDWVYSGTTKLADNGQWSQGVVYDDGLYYVAYHAGDHSQGNVVVAVYDENWKQVTSVQVTQHAPGKGNAFRPWLIKVGSKLYVSYDDVELGGSGGSKPIIYGVVSALDIETP